MLIFCLLQAKLAQSRSSLENRKPSFLNNGYILVVWLWKNSYIVMDSFSKYGIPLYFLRKLNQKIVYFLC